MFLILYRFHMAVLHFGGHDTQKLRPNSLILGDLHILSVPTLIRFMKHFDNCFHPSMYKNSVLVIFIFSLFLFIQSMMFCRHPSTMDSEYSSSPDIDGVNVHIRLWSSGKEWSPISSPGTTKIIVLG